MLILETHVFTRQVDKLLDEDSYRLFQLHLLEHPGSGAVIRGTGGLRKVRWKAGDRGKSGGVRVIYYWATAQGVILLLLMYRKAEQDVLTPQQKAILKRIVEEEFP